MNSPINLLFQAMKSKGIVLPQDINPNDPNQIIQYLMQSGRISQDQYNNAYQQYRSMFPQNNSR